MKALRRKHQRALVDLIEAQGWRVVEAYQGSKHLKLRVHDPVSRRTVKYSASLTPSDWRASRNTLGYLKRLFSEPAPERRSRPASR